MSSRCRLRRTRFVNAALTEQTRTARHTEGCAVNLSAATRRGRSSKGMLLGYARVSTTDQNLALQRDALAEAGCQKIFTEQLSGAVTDRPALHEALAFARSGDTLIVWTMRRHGASPHALRPPYPARTRPR